MLPLALAGQQLERVRYNNPGLTVDLGVGLWAWPLPMDYDGDGDLDLVVVGGGKPYEGTWFFENTGGGAMPVFKPGRKVAGYRQHVQISPDGTVMTDGEAFPDFRNSGFDRPVPLGVKLADIYPADRKTRANQWQRLDYDGDGDLDLIVGVGDWQDYGWDDAYNSDGVWTNGPLRGFVLLLENTGTDAEPTYAPSRHIATKTGEPIEVYGWPSPSFADFDGDGDLDLICGEFLDGFTYFENTGTRTEPVYAPGRRVSFRGQPVRMDLQMITPTAIDWDGDGDPDLIVGDEDGRVAFIENLGGWEFRQPVYFQQEAEHVKFGALITPFSFDWDGDGDEDIIAGNTAGYIGFIENLDGGDPPKWAAPALLEADGDSIRIQAGPNGSIQGPAEAKWGYTTLSVADWDGDGLPDLVVNSIWGKVVWYRNVGSRTQPKLAAAQPLSAEAPAKPEWNWWTPAPGEFVTQWRTTPLAVDWNRDGRMDLISLDEAGYLALFERGDGSALRPGQRIFSSTGPSVFNSRGMGVNAEPGPLRLNDGRAGASGRRKLALADWDGDGLPDLLVNSTSVDLFRNLGEGRFEYLGPLTSETLAGHTTSPTTVDWNGDGVPDLLIGAEDGFLYYLRNPREP